MTRLPDSSPIDQGGDEGRRPAIEDAEQYYRALFDLSLDGLLLSKIDGTILDANPTACRLLGMTVDEIRARGRKGIIVPGPDVDAAIRERERNGRVSSEVTFIRKDGSTFRAEFGSVVLPGDSPVPRAFVVFQDISQRKRDEAALRESEERYERLLDTAHENVWEIDENFRYTYWSPKIVQVIGYEPEELLGKTPFDLMAPGEAERLAELFGRIAAERVAFHDLESVSVHKDGLLVIAETTGIPLFAEDGSFRGYWGTSRDVTEHRRAEQELERSYDLLAKLAAQIPGAIYQYRLYPDGRACLPWASEAIRDVFEVTPEDVRQSAMPIIDRLHPDDRDRVVNLILESARTLERFHAEYRVVLPEKGLRWHMSDSSPERADDGGTLWHGVTLDITERKEMEEALRLSEDRYRQLVESAHDWIWECDEGGRFTFASPRLFDMLGYRPEEILGKTVIEFMPPDQAERMGPLLHSFATAKQPFHDLESVNLHKDGHLVFVETTGVPILDRDGNLLGFRGMDRDVTERKRADEALRDSEERLRQSQKLEAIGRLAGGIAHDFNNLLTAIMGYGDFVLSDPEFALTRWHSDVRQIKAAAERAAGLTQQILAFSRRQRLQSEIVSINDLISEITPLLLRTLGEDVEFVTVLSPDVAMVDVDPHQFTQVLMNLAVNARDAMPSGGVLTLRTDNVRLDEKFAAKDPDISPGDYVRLSVSDTGVGIDPGAIPLLYEPFYTTKPPGKGTGLGLPTVYGVVKQSRGAITVQSIPGRGTTFEVFLPRAKPEDAEEALGDRDVDVSPGAQSPRQERVLLVEDEEAVRRLTERMLENLGYAVQSAANGPQALALLEAPDALIDLLVTDVVLPGGIDGGEIARRARLVRKDLAVLYISGYTRNVVLGSGDSDENVHFLEKPFTSQRLALKVREALDEAKKTAN